MKNDKWFLEGCKWVASNSKCLSRKIGAIIIRDNRIISTGYNGPPIGLPHCSERFNIDLHVNKVDKYLMREMNSFAEQRKVNFEELLKQAMDSKTCPRQVLGYKSGEGLHLCIAGHAERNAIVNAARLGHKVKGCKMYMDCPVPCTPCLIEIINAGIEEIIITEFGYYDSMAEWIINNSNLKVRVYEINDGTL